MTGGPLVKVNACTVQIQQQQMCMHVLYIYICMYVLQIPRIEETHTRIYGTRRSLESNQTVVRVLLEKSRTRRIPGRGLLSLSWRLKLETDGTLLGSPVTATWPKNSSLIILWFQTCSEQNRTEQTGQLGVYAVSVGTGPRRPPAIQ